MPEEARAVMSSEHRRSDQQGFIIQAKESNTSASSKTHIIPSHDKDHCKQHCLHKLGLSTQ